MKSFFFTKVTYTNITLPLSKIQCLLFITQVNLYLLLKVQLVYSKGNYTFDKICEHVKYMKFLSALVSVGEKRKKIYS